MQTLNDRRQLAKVYEDGKVDLHFAVDSNFSHNKYFEKLKAQLDLQTLLPPTITNGIENHHVFPSKPKEEIVKVLKSVGFEVKAFDLVYLTRTGWQFQKTKMGEPDHSEFYPGIKFYSSTDEAQEDLQNTKTNNPDFIWKLAGPHGKNFPHNVGSYSIFGYRNFELSCLPIE
jgi:hypothetical protein